MNFTQHAWFAWFVGPNEPKYAIPGSVWIDTSNVSNPVMKVRVIESGVHTWVAANVKIVMQHATRHASGGADALTGNLDANARVKIKRAGNDVGARRSINFIPGSGISITVNDDSQNEKVDVTISTT